MRSALAVGAAAWPDPEAGLRIVQRLAINLLALLASFALWFWSWCRASDRLRGMGRRRRRP